MDNKTIKVFISQSMRNRSSEEILKERKDIENRLKEFYENIEILDTYFTDNAGPIECLGKSIVMLKNADLVVFANDYRSARGCRIENMVCIEYGIRCISNIYNDYYLESVFKSFK